MDKYFDRRVGTLFSIHLRYFLCVEKTASAYCFTNSIIVAVFFVYGKSSVDAVRFPVTRVPVSATVALHSKVLHNLHGRMSSGPPQPYFAEILRRGDNTAVRGAVETTLPFLRTAEP